MTLPDLLYLSGVAYLRQTPAVRYYRVPHDVEIKDYDAGDYTYMGPGYRSGRVRWAVLESLENPYHKPMPEVYRCRFPDHVTPLSCAWLRLWRELDPQLSAEKWRTLLGDGLAWMNGTGSPPRSNCVTGYVGDGTDPGFHAPIVNGGALLTGEETQDGWLLVDTLSTLAPVPSTAWVLARPYLWYWGTSVRADGGINYINRMSVSGTMIPVRVPLVTRLPIRWPLEWLEKLPAGFDPAGYDPRQMG